MNCDSCKSERVFEVGGKSSDRNNWTYKNGPEGSGYLPHVPNVCGGDYYDLSVCLNCGKVQGKFPVESEELETGPAEKAQQYFLDNYGNSPAKLYALGVVNPVDLLDAHGRQFCSHHDRWDREVYGFLVGPEYATEHLTYVFIDPEWDLDMVKCKHYAWPNPDHCELTEIVR